jgi:hypothetical protein
MKLNFTKFFITTLFISSYLVSHSQLEHRCATMNHYADAIEGNPQLLLQSAKMEALAKDWVSKDNSTKSNNPVSIPVVFHIVYNQGQAAAQDIPDATVHAVLKSLNQDFRRFNLDKTNTRPIFDSIAGDSKIQFCLATVDPNGNATNGIIHKSTTEANFDIFGGDYDKVKKDATGGSEFWPTSDYLNIWVCNLSGAFGTSVLGFASLPNISVPGLAIDGVVVHYEAFGVTGSVLGTPVRGRTVSHEVGHFFGLRHIWGDDGSIFGGATCDSTDYAYDTPMAQDNSQQSGCSFSKNSCSNEKPYWGNLDPPDMVENYMDYSQETCQNAFTFGQVDRMDFFLNDPKRSGLLQSNGCAGKYFEANFTTSGDYCSGPTVNFTGSNLGDSAVSYLWDFGDGSALVSQQNPTYTYNNPGVYLVRFAAFNALGEIATYEAWLNTNCQPLSISSNKLETFRIYPNPVSNNLNIELNHANGSYQIFNSVGQLIMSNTINNKIMSIPFGEFPNGVYNLRIESDHKISFQKIVKKQP